MRGLILTAAALVGLAGTAVAQPNPGAGGMVGAGVAGAGLPGTGGTIRPETNPSPAQPRGMVGGAGGPGGATNAGRAGDPAGVAGPRGATTEGGGSAGGGTGELR